MKTVALSLAAAILTSAGPSRVSREPAAFCSLVPLSGFETNPESRFIGTSTADSLPAKARRITAPSGEKFPVASPYAQIIRVERLGTNAPAEWVKGVRAAGNRIVVVPWSYNPDCTSTTWRGPALWSPPGTRGLFTGGMRKRSDWIQGIPTLDTGEPMDNPFPFGRGYSDAVRASSLSADEFLSMLDSIPTIAIDRADVVTRFLRTQNRGAAILNWASRHPDQAKRKPLSDWVSSYRDGLPRAHFDTIISPFAGTYRFILKMPHRDSVVFFGRTDLRPHGIIWSEGYKTPVRPADDPYGYYLYIGLSANPDSLPTGWPRFDRGGFFGIGFDRVSSDADSTVWRGDIDVLRSAGSLVIDSETRQALQLVTDVQLTQQRFGTSNFLPGRTLQRRDGSVTITWMLNDHDSTLVTITARRISKAVFQTPD
jgi:hypothetical protein